jgi:hypothetical protein
MNKATPKPSRTLRASQQGKIHPVIVYPFRQPNDHADLVELYGFVAKLNADKERYARPITVMDRKTLDSAQSDPRFVAFRKQTVSGVSDILDAWCVDTCQMWYTGLGAAFERGQEHDAYWLIPGDFNYGSQVGREVLSKLHDLPEIIEELAQDFCIGEITTDHNHSKHLIDDYGTFALLYVWFPELARRIREITEQPRSEFFAIRHGFLKEVLHQRWYAYEQTLVTLLHAVGAGRRVSRFSVGEITDLPHGQDTLDAAIQQIERTERVLKMCWRGRNLHRKDWIKDYLELENHSSEVIRSAFAILHNLLR